MRLDTKVERPLVYLAQRAPTTGGEDVLSSLQDEVLLGALGLAGSGSRNVKEVDAGAGVLHSVQRLLSRLSRYSEASEMALVGMVPVRFDEKGSRSRPLLVFHTYLRKDGVVDMQKLLDAGELAIRSRRVHDRQVYRFRSAGEVVEIALVVRDLVVSNDKKTMGRMLDPRTSASGGFAADPRFTRLRKKLDMPPGSLLFYADWEALRPRLDQVFRGDATWLMSLSGIELPEQLMFVARPAPRKNGQKRGIITNFLLRHASDSRKFGTGNADPKVVKTWRPDGWLDLLQAARPKDLLAGLPQGGIITIGTRLDFDMVIPTHHSKRVRRLQASIFHRCRHLRIDLRKEILRRLSEAGGAQFLLLDPKEGTEDESTGMRLAWSIRAKSSRDAKELFKVFQRMFVPTEEARLHGRGNRQELRFVEDEHSRGPLVLARVNDALVVAFSPDVIAEVRKMAEAKRKTPTSQRASTALTSRLQRLGVKPQQRLTGIIGLDLGFLANGEVDRAARKKGKSKDRFSGFLGLHGGFFSFEKDLVRLEVITELDDP